MLRREVEERIDKWIEKDERALLVSGARQVGKTYVIRECLKRSGTDLVRMVICTDYMRLMT